MILHQVVKAAALTPRLWKEFYGFLGGLRTYFLLFSDIQFTTTISRRVIFPIKLRKRGFWSSFKIIKIFL